MDVIKDLVHEQYHVWYPKENKELNINIDMQSRIFNNQGRRNAGRDENDVQNKLKSLNVAEIAEADLSIATNNWAQKNIIGKGGFGVVYKGEYLSTMVAIKKLEYKESRTNASSTRSKEHLIQSLNELNILNMVRHDNIVPIYGYRVSDDICYIVYQYMSGGSLDERLSKRSSGAPPLTWVQRSNIAKGAAK